MAVNCSLTIPASNASGYTDAQNASVQKPGKLGICIYKFEKPVFLIIGKRVFLCLLGFPQTPTVPSAQLRDFCEIASGGKGETYRICHSEPVTVSAFCRSKSGVGTRNTQRWRTDCHDQSADWSRNDSGGRRRITKSSSRRCTSFAPSRSARSRRQSPPAGQASRGFLQTCRRRSR